MNGIPKAVHCGLRANGVERARKFCAGLSGWKFEKYPDPMKECLIETAAPDRTRGIGGGMGEPGQQIINSFGVPALEEYIRNVEVRDGRVVLPKTAVPHMGYLAVCEDTGGNRFGIREDDREAA